MASKSKDKGNRGERELCKLLTQHFGKPFSRTVGSGNRWAHVEQPNEAYLGDIVCPEGFPFSIECKYGYENITLQGILEGNKQFQSFLDQAQADAKRVNKEPMLCFKQSRQAWLAFTRHGAPKRPLLGQTRLVLARGDTWWEGRLLTDLLECMR